MEPLAFQSSSVSPSGAAVAAVPITAFPKGEKLTLAGLFESEESGLLRFAIGLVRQRMVAEELVQETFLRLHQVWAQVENPRGGLYRSLRNLALNHLREHARETVLDEATQAAEADLPAEQLGQM